MSDVDYRLEDEAIDEIVRVMTKPNRDLALAGLIAQGIPPGYNPEYYRGIASLAYLFVHWYATNVSLHVIASNFAEILARSAELVQSTRDT